VLVIGNRFDPATRYEGAVAASTLTAWPGLHLPFIGGADDLATAVKRDGQGSNS